MSDHLPISLAWPYEAVVPHATHTPKHFLQKTLMMMSPPANDELFQNINDAVAEWTDWRHLADDLKNTLASLPRSFASAQASVDLAVQRMQNILVGIGAEHGIVRKRSSGKHKGKVEGSRSAAPPALRRLRLEASLARKAYVRLTRANAPADVICSAKRSWNKLSSQCRSVSIAVRRQFCIDWTRLWDQLRYSSSRQ
eukprot:6353693-Karenia_brevis.AAC.1